MLKCPFHEGDNMCTKYPVSVSISYNQVDDQSLHAANKP